MRHSSDTTADVRVSARDARALGCASPRDERNANARIVTRATKRVVDSWFESLFRARNTMASPALFAPFPRVALAPRRASRTSRASGGFRVAAFGRKTNDQIS